MPTHLPRRSLSLSWIEGLPAAQVPEKAPPPASVAKAIVEAEALTKGSKFPEAIALLEAQQKELGEKITDDEKRTILLAIANTNIVWAEADEKRYAWQEAIKHYLSAYNIEKNYRKQSEARLLHHLGRLHSYVGQKTRSLEFFNEALDIYRSLGHKIGEATALGGIGWVYNAMGEKVKALDFYNRSLPIYHSIGDKAGEAGILVNLGSTNLDLGETTKALELFNEALLLYRSMDNKEGQARTLGGIGNVYFVLSDGIQALNFYNQALIQHIAIGDRTGEANTLHNTALVQISLGNNAKSLDLSNQSLLIMQSLKNKKGEAAILHNIGGIYSTLGEKAKAIEIYKQALQLYTVMSDIGGKATTLSDIGLNYASLGENNKALEYYHQALPILTAVGDKRNLAGTLVNIGIVYSSLGEKSKALDNYRLALPIWQQIGNKRGEANTLNNIGKISLDLGDRKTAGQYFNQALPILRVVGDRNGEATTLANLMLLWRDPNLATWRLGVAAFYGKMCINSFQSIRSETQSTNRQTQQTFLKEIRGSYQTLTQLLVQHGRFSEAQQIYLLLNRQNAREAGTKIQPIEPDKTPLERELSDRYDLHTTQITAIIHLLIPLRQLRQLTAEQKIQRDTLEKQLTQIQDIFLRFINDLPDKFKNVPTQRVEKPKLATELQKALQTFQGQTKQKAAVVFTFINDEGIEFFVIQNERMIQRRQLVTRNILSQTIGNFTFALTALDSQGHPNNDPAPLAQKLYNLLIKPIQSDIAGCQQVFWMLDGKLRYIPLAALHDAKQYLIQGTQQHTLLSAEAINTLARKPQTARRILALATSKAHTTEGVAFPPLPGVPRELTAIKPNKALTEATFTKNAFLAELKKGYSIVHLATHFALRPGDLYTSFLLLGDGKALRLSEINDLPDDLFAGVDLLTLSACDTGSGASSSNGAELEGLSLVAQRKGAAAVLSTLWPVNDSSTAALMGRFYANLSKASKAEALRQAQLALLTGTLKPANGIRGPVAATGAKKPETSLKPFALNPKAPYAHPYYWAPFTLSGNTR